LGRASPAHRDSEHCEVELKDLVPRKSRKRRKKDGDAADEIA
jgi:hypothetical protein